MAKPSLTKPTFQKQNWCLTISIFILIVLTFYGIGIPQTIRSIMASSVSESSQEIPIKVTIQSTPPSTTSVIATLKVTLENTSPTQTIYILKWSSPLDQLSAAIGVFTFTSTKTGEKAPGLGLMVNHQMPVSGYFTTSDEEILEIRAGGKIEGTIEVKEHEILLEKGESYEVQARGRWMGVWIGAHERLGFEERSDLKAGEFLSEKIEVEIPA